MEALRFAERIKKLLSDARNSDGVIVVGAGKTGQAVARILSQAEYPVTILDERKMRAEVREELLALGATVADEFSIHDDILTRQRFGFAVLSPGVGLDTPIVQGLAKNAIPRISELDLGIAFLGMPAVAVTGTNGKTTTATLIHEMLEKSGFEAPLLGNIGTPFVGLLSSDELKEGRVVKHLETTATRSIVCEVSSYQLETAFDFVPKVAVWLNTTPDHLERHGSIEEYARVKSRIGAGQTDKDWTILNADDPYFGLMRKASRGRIVAFGAAGGEAESEEYFAVVSADGSFVELNGFSADIERYSLVSARLVGHHNRENFAAAIAAARLAGASADGIQQTIDQFMPLEHRLEDAGSFQGVRYINDSKATNVAAAVAAVGAIADDEPSSPLILLLGGRAKKGSWGDLIRKLPRRTKAVLFFGEDGELIENELSGSTSWERKVQRGNISCERHSSLEAAMTRANQVASSGDIVMLAPGCASFDAYPSFEARGTHFKSLVPKG